MIKFLLNQLEGLFPSKFLVEVKHGPLVLQDKDANTFGHCSAHCITDTGSRIFSFEMGCVVGLVVQNGMPFLVVLESILYRLGLGLLGPKIISLTAVCDSSSK